MMVDVICRSSIWIISLVDLGGSFQFLPASLSSQVLASWNVGKDEISTQMVGNVQGTVCRGYGLYVAVAKQKVLQRPFLPIFWIGSLCGFGPRLYATIAARRLALFGACELGGPYS